MFSISRSGGEQSAPLGNSEVCGVRPDDHLHSALGRWEIQVKESLLLECSRRLQECYPSPDLGKKIVFLPVSSPLMF